MRKLLVVCIGDLSIKAFNIFHKQPQGIELFSSFIGFDGWQVNTASDLLSSLQTLKIQILFLLQKVPYASDKDVDQEALRNVEL